VDAVYIPLPSSVHVHWARRAAEQGKHILLEKPIAVSAADTAAILDVCAEHNVQLMDGTMWVHGERTADMAAILRSGVLGALRDVTSTFTLNAPAGFDQNVRSKKDGDPLGALGDMGWYCVRGERGCPLARLELL
jgi:predicted dehydrogenase